MVVTGAAGGIGRALVQRLGRAGARVALLDLAEAAASAAAAPSGAPGIALGCDVTDAARCGAAIEAVCARWGGADVMVCNAGITHRSLFAETDVAVVRRVMDVNFFGAVHCVDAALPSLLARGGQIVALSSVAGFAPLVGRSAYAASKHALHGFFDSLRAELRGTGVDVLLVCPSFVDTAIDAHALRGDGALAGEGKPTIGRSLTADETAAAILHAAARRQRTALVSPVARASWWLSRLAPETYERLMRRRLGGEFDRRGAG